ncbi:mandelate racemase/muconate lactonizing enzyme family protein [Synoicihabitans lomoniglobus]|uniref:Mandelate racemase/muconate lactonizing enzyme family protein n=1 Tax=Synoicihabitans lomoniglobus TaxID=2909285 RepID=A0AAF0CSK5_9BACT|nr:mandelate racemase/muconate lactonizing enzyme family protein [Opitutaceae bacterium LMO-M01]WED67256.1 mandelate racemase/muconate lactonizing enzyme family protein [Opitutaceae bacterium LMO-M01]
MSDSRRSFLKKVAGGAALAAAAGAPMARANHHEGKGGHEPGKGFYGYLGRGPDYRDWQVIPEGLKITKIESFLKEQLAMVRVTVSDGSTGWGQIAPYEANVSVQMLHQRVVRRALGKDLSHIDAINDAAIDENMKYPWSFVCRALGGVDTAIWDLYGKKLNQPVAELLGGKVQPLAAYGSSMRRDISPADEAARMARLKDELNYQAFKIRLGVPTGHNGDAAPGRSAAIIPAVRKAVGDDVALFADANSCYTPDVAIKYGRMMQDHGYAMFEEPCPYWELEWTKEVTDALTMEVSGGEQDNEMGQWRRMIDMRAVDIVQPDICYIGGLTRAWRVAKLAEAAGLVCKPHAANVSMITVFTMHMLAALPNAGEVEFSIEDESGITRQARELFDPALAVADGKALMPQQGAGWGVHIKPQWLSQAEHRVSEL